MYRNTWMEVNLDAIAENVRETKKICSKKYIAVLKANAYGCGDIQVAKACLDAGADMIAVSSLDEAMMFRNSGYDGKLLILGATNPEDVQVMIDQHISTVCLDIPWAKKIIASGCEGLQIHLAVDTGMNRIGVKTNEELKEVFDLLKDNGCIMEGIFTHFACSDTKDHVMTDKQYQRFSDALDYLNYPFEWIHCDNSDATIFFKDPKSNACRVGISLYGISPYKDDLKQAVSLYTEVVMTKKINQGETVSYGATYSAEKDNEIIGTLPIGYADGLVRKNQGRKVYVDGMFCTLLGRVCMDQCMIELEHDVPAGTKVEIFGPHISIGDMAHDLETIEYEILCLITDRVTRKYIYHGMEYTEENPRLVKSENESK